MRPNRRETISLLAGAAPAALGMLSVAGTTNPSQRSGSEERATTGQGRPQKIETRIGTLEFTHDFANGYPTDATIEKLYDERDFQRACQAYLWSLPAVSFTSWQRGITQRARREERPDRRDPVSRGQARHPDRQRHDAVLSRVRRSLRRAVGHGDSAARRARRDQRRMATNAFRAPNPQARTSCWRPGRRCRTTSPATPCVSPRPSTFFSACD